MAVNSSGSSYRWMVLGIVMMGTFMAILDASIVNVALPHMMSAFGVGRDEIEWVSTAFMLATAIAMPLVGWLANRIGHKSLYLGSLAIFTLGSAFCAFAWSYEAMIAARVVQAVGGGAIQPIGMALIADLFEPHERGRALGIWGTGIMIGPALGPTLGGYLIDWFNWRTIFSVNLPFGILTLVVGMALIRGSQGTKRKSIPFDFMGFSFLSLFLLAGLLALSKGQSEGWSSGYIITCLSLSTVGLVLFIGIESSIEHPLLDLKLFRVRNFSLSMTLAIFRSLGLFGGIFLLPIFLESLVGYTTIQTGLWMMPGAIVVGITMPIAGRLSDRYGPRWLVFFGALLNGISMLMYGHLEPLSGALVIIGPQAVRGVGIALMMAPLMTAAINAVPRAAIPTVSSFLNVAQRVGGSFGIALLNTIVTNSAHTHAVRLGELLGTAPEALSRVGQGMSRVALANVPGSAAVVSDQAKAMVLLMKTIYLRAEVLGFQNGFVVGGLILLIFGMPLSLFLKRNEYQAG